jgi:hypothetical protein
MSRPITLFTGQWADMPLTELAEEAAGWGYDGLEHRAAEICDAVLGSSESGSRETITYRGI